MIDIHTHILPNIDDGARSIDETFNLIKEAKNAGFEAIVLTSHYKEGFYETDTPEREVWVNAIYENLQAKKIDVQLYMGNEIGITDKIINLLTEEKASTINDTSYVLFEMPIEEEPENMYSAIYQMTQNKVVPILAHPEKYQFIQEEPELMNDLIDRGVLMQADYGSIIGENGEKAEFMVRKFLENDMIHLLGSNVHRQNTIYPKMPQILSELNAIIGEQKLEELTTTNPKAVLHNKRIDIKRPNTIELTLKEKIFILGGSSINGIIKGLYKMSPLYKNREREGMSL